MSSYPNENSAIGGGDGDGGGGGGGDASVPEENSVEYMNGASVTSMSLWPGWAFTLVVMKSSGMIEARNMASLCGLCLRTRAMAHQHGSGAGHDDVCDECMGACTQQVSVVFAFEMAGFWITGLQHNFTGEGGNIRYITQQTIQFTT